MANNPVFSLNGRKCGRYKPKSGALPDCGQVKGGAMKNKGLFLR